MNLFIKNQIEKLADNFNLVAKLNPYTDEEFFIVLHDKIVGMTVGDAIRVTFKKDTAEMEIDFHSQKFNTIEQMNNFSNFLQNAKIVIDTIKLFINLESTKNKTRKFETAPINFSTKDCVGNIVSYWLQNEKMNENGFYEKVTSGLEKYEYAEYELTNTVELTLDDINEIAI